MDESWSIHHVMGETMLADQGPHWKVCVDYEARAFGGSHGRNQRGSGEHQGGERSPIFYRGLGHYHSLMCCAGVDLVRHPLWLLQDGVN